MMGTEQARELVGYCGLYCGLCGIYKGRIVAKVAADLQELVAAHEFADWVPRFVKIDFSFSEFEKGLAYFCDEQRGPYCQHPCKEGGGPPCKIRPCAQGKDLEICFECDEFPCELLSRFLERHPEIIEEKEAFERLGMERWLGLKADEAKRGYVYATGKCYTGAKNERSSTRHAAG